MKNSKNGQYIVSKEIVRTSRSERSIADGTGGGVGIRNEDETQKSILFSSGTRTPRGGKLCIHALKVLFKYYEVSV